MMRLLYRRLLHAIDNHGVTGAALRVLQRRPAGARVEAQNAHAETLIHPFDLRYGTDTSGYVPGEDLVSGGSSDLYNTAYYGISPSTLTQAIAALPIDPRAYTFVDLGCGKGRALLVAAQANFKAIAGVEISPALAAAAQANVRDHPNICVQAGDAANVVYLDGPLVVFLYHPFLAPVLRKVLRNVIDQAVGREVYLLAANPIYRHVYNRFPQVQEMWRKEILLSEEDAAADRHGITSEPYSLWRIERTSP